MAGKYVALKRRWAPKDEISLEFPMNPKLIEGHPRIEETRNQVAVKRGPIVYCVESPDLPKGTEILNVYLPSSPSFEAKYKKGFLGGVTTLNTTLKIRKGQEKSNLYNELKQAEWESQETQLVPYFAWSNRGLAEMSVFMPILWNQVD